MEQIKVSVIVPIYNMEPYLTQCLESIVCQSLQKIEIICVDDSSTDKSAEIVAQYAQVFKNVHFLQQSHCGAGTARNCAMNIACGEFVAFMDGDDYYPEADVLETLYYAAKKHKVAICGGSLCTLSQGRIARGRIEGDKPMAFVKAGKQSWREAPFIYGYTRFLYNLEMLRAYQIVFPRYIRYQDPPFLMRAMLRANIFYAVPKNVYVYRQIPKLSIMSVTALTDTLRAMLDILALAKLERLFRLQYIIVEELRHNFLWAIYYHIIAENHIVEKLWRQFIASLEKRELRSICGSICSEFTTNRQKIAACLDILERKKQKLLQYLQQAEAVYIYGAGTVGILLAQYLMGKDIPVQGFIVSPGQKHAETLLHLPV